MSTGILSDLTRIVVETDEENPIPIATLTNDFIDVANGYRVRLKPMYKD